jgi:O-antigen ligase
MPSLLFGLCAFTIVCSVVLGGATRNGSLSDGILQYLALPLLLVALWRLIDRTAPVPVGKTRPLLWELLFCGTIVLVPLVQLVPLPPFIWSALPNRGPMASVFELLGGEMPWMPISVSSEATWLSALSLLPPIAIFLGCALLGHRERRLMSLVVLAVGVVSVFLGLLQVSQGPSSSLRFFEITNSSEAVGFFANRNHLAALLYAVTVVAAAWTIEATFAAQSGKNRSRYDTATVVPLVIGFTVLIILISAQAMARSRAGLGLTIVAIFGALVLACWDRRAIPGPRRRGSLRLTPAKLLMGATAVAMVFAVQFALYRVMERFTSDPLEDARIPFARNTIEAAKAYMPFGSGMGTFVPVYGMYEKPQDLLVNAYANRAHDDVLELWLETGVVGIILMGLFVTWVVLRAVKVWGRPPGAREIDISLSRAATLVIALLIAHSFVDYPLRTGAMMAILAFACALLVAPPRGAARAVQVATQDPRDVTRQRGEPQAVPAAVPLRRRTRPRPVPSGAAPSAPALPPEWGVEGLEWPQEWRQPVTKPSTGVHDKVPNRWAPKPEKSPNE